MTLMELKELISTNRVPSDFMIFVKKDNTFLASQYIKAIGDLSDGGLRKVNSIYEPQQSSISLLTVPEGTISIVNVDTFDERSEDYDQFENTIVVCEQVDKSIIKNVEKYIINFPKLEDWQIFDYAKTICNGIDDADLQWLIKASGNSIERVINELSKVTLFKGDERKAVFASIRFDAQSDLYQPDLFTIVNALVEGDSKVLFEFLKHNCYDTIEPVVLANRALTSLKNIIIVSQNYELTAEDCGVSANQLRFIRTKYHSLNINAIKQKIKFLTNFDFMLKTSCLDLNKRDMLSYLVNNLNYKITM